MLTYTETQNGKLCTLNLNLFIINSDYLNNPNRTIVVHTVGEKVNNYFLKLYFL